MNDIKSVITKEPMMMSDMAFWNPSEIIGSNPRPLDYSLYRAIITHRAWNQGIARIGFRKLEEDLMHRVGNKPYICLEYAFSFFDSAGGGRGAGTPVGAVLSGCSKTQSDGS